MEKIMYLQKKKGKESKKKRLRRERDSYWRTTPYLIMRGISGLPSSMTDLWWISWEWHQAQEFTMVSL